MAVLLSVMHCATCGRRMTQLQDGSYLLCCGPQKASGYWYDGELYIGEKWPRGKKAKRPAED